MILIEFVVFVVSSGLFFSDRFRHHLWAVLVAGGIATGSSLLFVYDLVERLAVHPQAPVKIVTQVVRVPVVQHISQPPSLAKPKDCRGDYPFFARMLGREGTTELAFQVRANGTVGDIKVTKSSGHDALDEAAVKCVSRWHYRPAIQDNQLVDAPMTASVVWNLDGDATKSADPAAKSGDGK